MKKPLVITAEPVGTKLKVNGLYIVSFHSCVQHPLTTERAAIVELSLTWNLKEIHLKYSCLVIPSKSNIRQTHQPTKMAIIKLRNSGDTS